MSSIPLFGYQSMNFGISSFPADTTDKRGKFRIVGGLLVHRTLQSEDAISVFNLTLSNVVVGSFYQIEELDGTVRVNGIASTSNITLSLDVFSVSSRNDLRVKIGKASQAPYYQRYETQVTAMNGSASIFVNQVRDDI